MAAVLFNISLLFAEATVYFAVMAALFRNRHRHGIGLFMCALGVMHFLETYLAAVFYVAGPFGAISPGSAVLFSGKLLMILLLYIKEDARAVRQPIYGLFLGNLLVLGLVLILRQQDVLSPSPGRAPDLAFLDEMGWLMLWGTALLLVDSLAIVLLYEQIGKRLTKNLTIRIALSAMCILSFDQMGFYVVLHTLYGAPLQVLFGGWAAKMAAAIFYSALVSGYLRWVEARPIGKNTPLSEIFDELTYREKYEALLVQSARDSLTGVLNRNQFETLAVGMAAKERSGDLVSLIAIDIDMFKTINDQLGHRGGDGVLQAVARIIGEGIRGSDKVFRYGGDEFVIVCPGTPHTAAILLAERLRTAIKLRSAAARTGKFTISAGVATGEGPQGDLATLFAQADARLYQAKNSGRDRIVGEKEASGDGSLAKSQNA
jgi:diguanylate cyclase (GGDEF)-like protein